MLMRKSHKEVGTMEKQLKPYETADVEVINLGASDILTLSAGFEGEEHTFSLLG